VNSQIAVPAQGVVAIGAQDEGGVTFKTSSLATPPSSAFPQSQMFLNPSSLTFVSGLSVAPGYNFTIAKSSWDFGPTFDSSGYSNDGFQSNWLPFNRWNTLVAGSALSSYGGAVEVTLPSTSGLTTFAAGQTLSSNSIVCVLAAGSFATLSGFSSNCFPITVIGDGTHIVLQGSTFHSGMPSIQSCSPAQAANCYVLWVPAEALDTAWGTQTIVNVADDSTYGLVQVTMDNATYFGGNGAVACISGVTMTGSTTVNGCWVVSHQNGTSFDLASSTWSTGDSYVTGGTVATWGMPGGSVAASSETNWTSVGGDRTFPLCTTDAGQDWSPVRVTGDVTSSWSLSTNGVVPAGSTSFTVNNPGSHSGSILTHVVLTSGRWFYMSGTLSGSTYTITTPAIPQGDSIPNGAILYTDTGWPFAAYLNSHTIVADQVTPNTFYAINGSVGLIKWTNCGTPSVIASTSTWSALVGFNDKLEAVPGEAGHLFYTAGPQGTVGMFQPGTSGLWRTCNASGSSATWQQVTGMFEPQTFGFGAAAPGESYPAIYVVGWYSSDNNVNDAQYGIWKSINDPNNGATGTCNLTENTWTNIGTSALNATNGLPLGWGVSNPTDISGDPFIYGPVYYSGSYGAFYLNN